MNISAFKPQDESGRLAALQRYGILDSAPEKDFQEIVNLLKSVLGVPYASVNLIDTDRQWVKAIAGAEPFVCARSDAFCDKTIRDAQPLVVTDASTDPRFQTNRFVTGPEHIRCYLGVPLQTPDGYNIGALCVFGEQPRDFTAAEIAVVTNFARVVMSHIELRVTARQDSLTGTLTRRAFCEQLTAQLEKGPEQAGALLLLDLDHFKSINDTFGHGVGDTVLCKLARVMQGLVRRPDVVGRLGGEEFAIVLCGASLDEAHAVAERLRTRVEQVAIKELNGRVVTISAGIAAAAPGDSVDSWLARADRALYDAKQAGRNRVHLAPGGAAQGNDAFAKQVSA